MVDIKLAGIEVRERKMAQEKKWPEKATMLV